MSIRFIEHHEPGYAARTVVNARFADLTIAFAVDFKTPGEILTHKAAYGKYVGINFGYLNPEEMRSPAGIELPFAIQESLWRLEDKKVKHINFAGNGIYTLIKHGFDQAHVDLLFINYLSQVLEAYPDIKTIRSGCQSGIDEAALKAGHALGLECIGLAPKNWMWRDINGKDQFGEEKFLARFGSEFINDI